MCMLQDGVCVIDDVCYQAEESNPNNSLEVCDPNRDPTAWSEAGESMPSSHLLTEGLRCLKTQI